MAKGFEAKTSITIDASRARVWDALTKADQVKQYMHGTDMSTSWKVGSAITWKGEWKGKPYEDKGKVLAVEPEHMLQYTHWSPMGGNEDRPENYHTVTYLLTGDDGRTKLTLTQDNNPSRDAAAEMAEKNWQPVLEGLKEVAEKG